MDAQTIDGGETSYARSPTSVLPRAERTRMDELRLSYD